MRKAAVLTIALALASVALGAQDANDGDARFLDGLRITFGQLNDNLPCPYSWGIAGWSIGPDDQYTSQSVVHAAWREWSLAADDVFVTSRLFGYRLDILRLAASRIFDLKPFFLRASAGLALQGHFAGQELQNAWHRYVVLYPELDLPYQCQDAAFYAGGDSIIALSTARHADCG